MIISVLYQENLSKLVRHRAEIKVNILKSDVTKNQNPVDTKSRDL